MRRWRAAGAWAVAAVAVVPTVVWLAPAVAHTDPEQDSGWLYRSHDSNCTEYRAIVDHGNWKAGTYSYLAYSWFGAYHTSCSHTWERPPGNIELKLVFLDELRQPCYETAIIRNGTSTFGILYSTNRSMREPCGDGLVRMNSAHYVYNGSWYGGWVTPSGTHNYYGGVPLIDPGN